MGSNASLLGSSYSAVQSANSNLTAVANSANFANNFSSLDSLYSANLNLTGTTHSGNFGSNDLSLASNTYFPPNISSTNTFSSSTFPINNVTQSELSTSFKQPNSITKITEGKLKELGQETENKKAYKNIKSIGCSWSKTAYLKNISLLCDIEEDNYRHASSLNSQNAQGFNFSLRFPKGSQQLTVLREKQADGQGKQLLRELKIISSEMILNERSGQQNQPVSSIKLSTTIGKEEFNWLAQLLEEQKVKRQRTLKKSSKSKKTHNNKS